MRATCLRIVFSALALFSLGAGGGSCRGPATVGVFNLASNYVLLSLDNTDVTDDGTGVERRFHFGYGRPAWSSSFPVRGDWDGDGKDSLGFYNVREGRFYLSNTNTPGTIDLIFAFAPVTSGDGGEPLAGLIPVAGDWLPGGPAGDTVGLYDTATATFYLRFSNSSGGPDLQFTLGTPGGSLPVAGDWDKDGVDTVGVYDPATTAFVLTNDNTTALPSFAFGSAPGFPVADDWNNDGTDSVGVLVAGGDTLQFELTNTNQTGPPDKTVSFAAERSFFEYVAGEAIPTLYPVAGRWSRKGDATPSTGFPWATEDPAQHGLDPVQLADVVTRAQGETHVHALLVARDGVIVTEAYFRGWDATMSNNVKSVSKSLLSALVGVALERGDLPNATPQTPMASLDALSLGANLAGYTVPAPVTLRHMVTMSAGFAWNHSPGASLSSMIQSPDWVGFVVGEPWSSSALGTFDYSTGLTHVGSEVLARAGGMDTLAYANSTFFGPAGMEVTRWDWEPNPAATSVGGAEVWMRPRDMARFGQLYLRDGQLENGTQLFSPQWAQDSTSFQITGGTSVSVRYFDYGAWWWVGTFQDASGTAYPAYHALGFGGQHIVVFPTLDMVVVVTSGWGATSGARINANYDLVEGVLDALTTGGG